MNDWLIWNGVNSLEYGVHALAQPVFTTPKERYTTVNVPGRSGALTITEGTDIFDPVQLSVTCVIDDSANIYDISKWLKGSGEVTFATLPFGYYKGRISNQISFDKIVVGQPHRSFVVQFDCYPFLYKADRRVYTYAGLIQSFTNEGNMMSEPIIKITGSGDCTITCGAYEMAIADLPTYMVIDSEAKIAYKGSPGSTTDPLLLTTSHISGDWIRFPTGTFDLIMTGSITGVEVTPRWRWY